MRSLLLALCGFFVLAFQTMVYADNNNNQDRINLISLPISAESFAQTNTAKVYIDVSAIVNDKNIDSLQNQIQQNLKKLVPEAKWQLTRFNRSQNSSGLEQVRVTAQTRVPNTLLGSLRSKAEQISVPGQKYLLGNIDFSPSLAEMEETRTKLRQVIYERAKEEIANLNKIYPNQKYFLHEIKFFDMTERRPSPLMKAYAVEQISSGAPAAAPMQTSDQIVLRADVIIGSEMPVTLNASATVQPGQ